MPALGSETIEPEPVDIEDRYIALASDLSIICQTRSADYSG